MVCRSAYGLPTSIRSADQQMVCRPAYGPPTSMWSADLPSACAQVADSAAFPSQARASRFSTWTTTCACTAPSTASTSCSSEPAAGRSEEAARQPAHSWQMSWWRVFTNEADSMLRLAGVIHVELVFIQFSSSAYSYFSWFSRLMHAVTQCGSTASGLKFIVKKSSVQAWPRTYPPRFHPSRQAATNREQPFV